MLRMSISLWKLRVFQSHIQFLALVSLGLVSTLCPSIVSSCPSPLHPMRSSLPMRTLDPWLCPMIKINQSLYYAHPISCTHNNWWGDKFHDIFYGKYIMQPKGPNVQIHFWKHNPANLSPSILYIVSIITVFFLMFSHLQIWQIALLELILCHILYLGFTLQRSDENHVISVRDNKR